MPKQGIFVALVFLLVLSLFLLFIQHSQPAVEGALEQLAQSEVTPPPSETRARTLSTEERTDLDELSPEQLRGDPPEQAELVRESWWEPYFNLIARISFYISVGLLPLVILSLLYIILTGPKHKKHLLIMALIMLFFFLLSQCAAVDGPELRPGEGPGLGDGETEVTEDLEEPEVEEGIEDPEGLEPPEKPDLSEDPDPTEPPEVPEKLEELEVPEDPEDLEDPETPEELEDPEEPEDLEDPGDPEAPGVPVPPEDPEAPEEPEDPEDLEDSEATDETPTDEFQPDFEAEVPGHFYQTQNIRDRGPFFRLTGEPGTNFLRTEVMEEIGETGRPVPTDPEDLTPASPPLELTGVKESAPTREIQSHEFKIETLPGRENEWLPVPHHPRQIKFEEKNMRFSPDDRLARSEGTAVFNVEHEVPEHNRRQLRRLETKNPDDNWLAGPDQMHPRVEQWLEDFRAARSAETLASPYLLAEALEEKFLDDFPFSLLAESPPSETDFLHWFLFEEASGNAQMQNTAFTLLLRELGVPARLVHGYRINPEAEEQLISGGVHTKVEIPFQDAGFLHFDGSGIDEVEPERLDVNLSLDSLESGWRIGEQLPVEVEIYTENGDTLPDGRLRWQLRENDSVVLENETIFQEKGRLSLPQQLPPDLNRGPHKLVVSFPGRRYETEDGWYYYNSDESKIEAETWLPWRQIGLDLTPSEDHWYRTETANIQAEILDDQGETPQAGVVEFSLYSPDADTLTTKEQTLPTAVPLNFQHHFSANADTGPHRFAASYSGERTETD